MMPEKGIHLSTFFVNGGILFVFLLTLVGGFIVYAQEQNGSSSKRGELERQLQLLEKEAEDLDIKLLQTQGETRTLASELRKVDTEVKIRELEIKRLALVIKKADFEIKDKIARIDVLSRKISKNRKALGAGIFLMYLYDQDSVLVSFLKNKNISEFFTSVYNLEKTEGRIQQALGDFKEERTEYQVAKDELEEFQGEQQDLKALQEVERRFLAEKKKEKEELLRLTKGKEALFQKLLTLKKRDIATLRTQLFYLEKTGITAEDAIRFADLAAQRAGIRTAFLLALLEVETGKQFEDGVISVGTNVGTGNWKNDMYDCYIKLGKRKSAEAEKSAFFSITAKLNLDPDKMPVSRRPSYGCGGAMGPAQFLPTTWLRFESRLTALTSHNPPSPWDVEDAFTAAAIFLAEAGASSKTTAGEIRAAKTYLSGSPNCSRYICRSYSSRIVSLARDIDRIL